MIKPLDVESFVTAVWIGDNAIDMEKSKVKAYAEACFKDPGAWRDLIVAKPGEKLTEFDLGVIPSGRAVAMQDEFTRTGGAKGLGWQAFLYSVRDIRNGPQLIGTDASGKTTATVPKVHVGSVEYVDPEWLSRVFVRSLREAAIHMGMIAWTWNQLGEDDAKK